MLIDAYAALHEHMEKWTKNYPELIAMASNTNLLRTVSALNDKVDRCSAMADSIIMPELGNNDRKSSVAEAFKGKYVSLSRVRQQFAQKLVKVQEALASKSDTVARDVDELLDTAEYMNENGLR